MLDQTMPPPQVSAVSCRVFFSRTLAGILFLLAATITARAHPLKAPPLDHPHVYTFDQFYLPEDDGDFLTQGGLLLLAELNCAACHTAPVAWRPLIGPKPGPDLRGTGSRMDIDALWRLIRSPQHRKPGTQMPGLFAGNEESDPDTIEAIATYLASLQKSDLPPPPPGDPEHGKILYHTLGCVACHEPGTDYRPASLPPEADLESPSLASVPLALADDYNFPALTAFLLDPLATRPASRMPAQHLSMSEAADIAAYLHIGRLPAAFQERKILNLAPQSASDGRRLFEQHRCTACHDAGAGISQPPDLPPLAKLNASASTGCLSGVKRTGTPRYDLSALQTRALKLAILHLHKHPTPTFSPAEELTHQMSRLNCYACHDHDGRGGPEIARAPYFSKTLQLRPNDDIQGLPPSLDSLRPKHTSKSLLNRLTQPDPAPPEGARMPRFLPDVASPLSRLLLSR